MEFIDEDIKLKPRFHSRNQQSQISQPQIEEKPNKSFIFICFSLSSLLFFLSIFFFQSDILKFMLLWLAFSLIVAPFAPSAVTGGDVRVGRGDVIEFAVEEKVVDEIVDSKKRGLNRRQVKDRSHRSDELGFSSSAPAAAAVFEFSDRDPVDETGESKKLGFGVQKSGELGVNSTRNGESDWNDEDMEMLKKQLLKHPAGKPRRWEIISNAFQGRHGVESVIKQAKSMGEKKPSDGDSFSEFLKHRKPLDKRLETENDDVNNGEIKTSDWSSGEDLALLNALKVFPKEVAMRWEKIAAAVPGKTKAACVKRVAELKKDFRSSKG